MKIIKNINLKLSKSNICINNYEIAACLSFFLVGFFVLYIKSEMIIRDKVPILRFLGKNHWDSFNLEEIIFIFSNDLLVNFFIIPSIFIILFIIFNKQLIYYFSFVINIILIFFLFVNMRVFAETGNFLTNKFIDDAVFWLIDHPLIVKTYVTTESIIKLIVIILLLIIVNFYNLIFTLLSIKLSSFFKSALNFINKLNLCVIILLIIFSISLKIYQSFIDIGNFYYARSIFSILYENTFFDDENIRHIKNKTFQQLSDEFKILSKQKKQKGSLFDRKNKNIIIFVMETGTKNSFDWANRNNMLVTINNMYKNSIISDKHYTTYPYTTDALFSIITGMYPEGRKRLEEGYNDTIQNSLFNILNSYGYITAIYSPSIKSTKSNEKMFKLLDANYIFIADENSSEKEKEIAHSFVNTKYKDIVSSKFEQPLDDGPISERFENDIMALFRLKNDVESLKRSNKNFCFLFIPQIGHAPWLNLKGKVDMLEKGADIIALQDMWLGEIIDTLDKNKMLNDTIVIFTADHGIRTKSEDPAFVPGILNEYSFHVPLLLFDFESIKITDAINFPTSHVDIAPTILSLIGLEYEASSMHGTQFWNRTANDRIFFYAKFYGGCDGFVENSKYYMIQSMTDQVYISDEFNFKNMSAVNDESKINFILNQLKVSKNIQNSSVEYLLYNKN